MSSHVYELGLENTYGSLKMYKEENTHYLELDDCIGHQRALISKQLYKLLYKELIEKVTP